MLLPPAEGFALFAGYLGEGSGRQRIYSAISPLSRLHCLAGTRGKVNLSESKTLSNHQLPFSSEAIMHFNGIRSIKMRLHDR